MAPERYFMEVPLYRCTEKKFSRKYQTDLEAHLSSLWPADLSADIVKELTPQAQNDFWKKYGVPWRYNQCVGWIRLYALGDQIRGELWFVSAAKLQRRPQHKRFEKLGKVFEYHPSKSDDSVAIRARVRADLIEAAKDTRNGKLHLDIECFDNLSSHINWRRLLDNE